MVGRAFGSGGGRREVRVEEGSKGRDRREAEAGQPRESRPPEIADEKSDICEAWEAERGAKRNCSGIDTSTARQTAAGGAGRRRCGEAPHGRRCCGGESARGCRHGLGGWDQGVTVVQQVGEGRLEGHDVEAARGGREGEKAREKK